LAYCVLCAQETGLDTGIADSQVQVEINRP
jgi:hypothetical protein